MNVAGLALIDLAAAVSEHLKAHAIEVVVVGGSAITAHVPDVYTSSDIDFAVTSGLRRRDITAALKEIGFRADGRVFAHPDSPYALDFVADTPSIDAELIEEYDVIMTARGPVRVYFIEDAIADRIAAFLHWSDSQSLDVAERSASAARAHISPDRLRAALNRLDPGGPDALKRLNLARERLEDALRSED